MNRARTRAWFAVATRVPGAGRAVLLLCLLGWGGPGLGQVPGGGPGFGLFKGEQAVEWFPLDDSGDPEQSVATDPETGGALPLSRAPMVGRETIERAAAFNQLARLGKKLREELDPGPSGGGPDALLAEEFLAAQAEAGRQLGLLSERLDRMAVAPVIRDRHRAHVAHFRQQSEACRAAVDGLLGGDDEQREHLRAILAGFRYREPSHQPGDAGPGVRVHTEQAPRRSRGDGGRATEVPVQSGPSAEVGTAIPRADPPVSGEGAAAIGLDSEPQPEQRNEDGPDGPQPADLEPTPDVQIAPEITTKAAELGNSPLAIYEFTRNRIRFQPYLGSRKGAIATLNQGAGNDTDQASLLIALLRAAGIPCRYVRGSVEMSAEQARSWLGVEDAAVAASILTTAGLDGVAIYEGPEVASVRCTRVWVEAFVPYSNYRGVPGDATGKVWVPLDPAFQGSVVEAGEDVLAAMGLDIEAFLDTHLSAEFAASPIERLQGEIQDWLDANQPGRSVADIMWSVTQESLDLGLLPSSLPCRMLAVAERSSALDTSRRFRVRVHLRDGALSLIDHEINLPDLAGRELMIRYSGATQADRDAIDSFGGIYNTPPNLVNVVPELLLGGVVVASSSGSVGMGRNHGFDLHFLQPAGGANRQPVVQNEIAAGNTTVVAFDTFLDVPAGVGGFDAVGVETGNLVVESLLYPTAVDYLSRVDRGMETAGAIMGVVTTQDVSEAILTSSVAVSYQFGIPVTFEWTGLIVDADRRIVGPFSASGSPGVGLGYMLLTGHEGSTMENRVFEDLYGRDAVSTIKILQLASEAGIPLCEISTGIATDCPGFSHGAEVAAAVNAALAMGHVVTIPRDPITVDQWSGTGYIDLEPATGAAAYIIAGGISAEALTAGGATVQTWPVALACEAVPGTLRARVLSPAADAPDPSAVFCPGGDRITFTVELSWDCDGMPGQTMTVTRSTTRTTRQIKDLFGAGYYEIRVAGAPSQPGMHPRRIAIAGVEIRPDDGQPGRTGNLVPSVNGAGGEKHYVSPKKSTYITDDFVVLKAVCTPPGLNFDAIFEWVGGQPHGDPKKRNVPRAAASGNLVRIRCKGGGAEQDRMNVWVVWSAIAGRVENAEVSAVNSNSGHLIGTTVRFPYACTATIVPVSVITAGERPDLGGANSVAPPGDKNSCGNPLSGGAHRKWDMSRRIRIRAQTNAANPALALPCVDNDDDFPADPVVGNDDAGTGDEVNDPYANGGVISSTDRPSRNFTLAGGVAGNTYQCDLTFEEFARLEIGGKWYNVSDPEPWSVQFKFVKDTLTEAIWGIDVNGDGDQADTLTEAQFDTDTNGDGDKTDNVTYWKNNGSSSAN